MKTRIITLALVICTGTLMAQTRKVELKLDLPAPQETGTPAALKTMDLDNRTGRERPAFYVPEGTALLSLEKTVSSSDTAPVIGDLEQLTDGDKEAPDGSFFELGPGRQWVQIDLGKAVIIEAVALWHYHQEACVYRDVIVQVADDPDFITNVRTLFNNDHDNSSGMGSGKDKEYLETHYGRLISGQSQEARYIRCYSNGSTRSEMNQYIEVEVYGTTK